MDYFVSLRNEYIHEQIEKGNITVNKGAEELLEYLVNNDYRFALATGGGTDETYAKFERAGFTEYLDGVPIIGRDHPNVKKGKPHADIYRVASEAIGVKPKNCIAIEDTQAGITTAYNARIGIRVVYRNDWNKGIMFENQTHEVNDHYEFIELIKSLSKTYNRFLSK